MYAEKILACFINQNLVKETLTQTGEQLMMDFTHVNSTDRVMEMPKRHILSSSSLGLKTFVEGKGKVSIRRGQHVTAHFSLMAVFREPLWLWWSA